MIMGAALDMSAHPAKMSLSVLVEHTSVFPHQGLQSNSP